LSTFNIGYLRMCLFLFSFLYLLPSKKTKYKSKNNKFIFLLLFFFFFLAVKPFLKTNTAKINIQYGLSSSMNLLKSL
jgi:hypothetical protein